MNNTAFSFFKEHFNYWKRWDRYRDEFIWNCQINKNGRNYILHDLEMYKFKEDNRKDYEKMIKRLEEERSIEEFNNKWRDKFKQMEKDCLISFPFGLNEIRGLNSETIIPYINKANDHYLKWSYPRIFMALNFIKRDLLIIIGAGIFYLSFFSLWMWLVFYSVDYFGDIGILTFILPFCAALFFTGNRK